MSKRVLVTGGAGKAGRACIRDLLDHGYHVVSTDQVRPANSPCPFVEAHLCDYGQCVDVLSYVDDRIHGIDAVVHLAAIPAPGLFPNALTFTNNVVSTYNIFEAARRVGVKNIVWASSETVLGLPFETPPPYVPVDEAYPARPETAYSLSKYLGEQMAEQFCRWDPTTKIIGLRFSNIMEPHDYARFPDFEKNVRSRKWNLWGYIDARDAAQSIRKSLEASLTGAHAFIIANAETVMTRSNDELLNEVFPGVPRKGDVGESDTLLAIGKAKRMLGYEPQFSWRTELTK